MGGKMSKEWHAEYHLRNKAKHNASSRAFHLSDREEHNRKSREYHWAHRDEILIKKRAYCARPEIKAQRANMLRLVKYGLTAEQHEAMLQKQNGLCAICSASEQLVVDHCHDSGEVRALLCNPCNQVLGLIREDITRLEQMKEYLVKAAMVKAQAVVSKAGGPPSPAGAGQPMQGQPGGQ